MSSKTLCPLDFEVVHDIKDWGDREAVKKGRINWLNEQRAQDRREAHAQYQKIYYFKNPSTKPLEVFIFHCGSFSICFVWCLSITDGDFRFRFKARERQGGKNLDDDILKWWCDLTEEDRFNIIKKEYGKYN